MGSSLFEQNLSGSAFRRGLPLPREIRLTGIILSSSLSLFLSRWVKNRPVNCHDGLTSPEGYEQASKASPASRILHAATKSALAEKPHCTQTNFACLLRFSADIWPHSGQERLVFWGGTAINNPPRHNALYSNWRRSSNGEASRIARFNPD